MATTRQIAKIIVLGGKHDLFVDALRAAAELVTGKASLHSLTDEQASAFIDRLKQGLPDQPRSARKRSPKGTLKFASKGQWKRIRGELARVNPDASTWPKILAHFNVELDSPRISSARAQEVIGGLTKWSDNLFHRSITEATS